VQRRASLGTSSRSTCTTVTESIFFLVLVPLKGVRCWGNFRTTSGYVCLLVYRKCTQKRATLGDTSGEPLTRIYIYWFKEGKVVRSDVRAWGTARVSP